MQEKIVSQDKSVDKSGKKVMILCIVTLVVVVSFAGVMLALNRNKTDELPFEQFEMSYKDFKMGMKTDLSQETEKNVKEIYDQMSKALKNGDNKKIDELYGELDKLDVYDSSMNFSDGIEFIGDGSEAASSTGTSN